MSFAGSLLSPQLNRHRRMSPEWFAQRLGIPDLKGRRIEWVNDWTWEDPKASGCKVRCRVSIPGTTTSALGWVENGRAWSKQDVHNMPTLFEKECVEAVHMALVKLDAALEGVS